MTKELVGDNDHGDADPIRFLIARLRDNTYSSTDPKEAADLLEEMVDAIDDRDGIMESVDQLADTAAKLTEERDEARREVMMWLSERSSRSELTNAYKKRGWEYLKENNNV